MKRALFMLMLLVGCRSEPRPVCDGCACACWYYCDANWHPSRMDLPTTTDASGRVLHWRGCE